MNTFNRKVKRVKKKGKTKNISVTLHDSSRHIILIAPSWGCTS